MVVTAVEELHRYAVGRVDHGSEPAPPIADGNEASFGVSRDEDRQLRGELAAQAPVWIAGVR